MDIEINDKQVLAMLAEINDLRTLKPAIVESMIMIHDEISVYPPQINAGYDRTDLLGAGWTSAITTDTPDAIEGIVGNNVAYAGWVQSSEKINGVGPQAKIHQGNWATVQDVSESAAPDVVAIVSKLIREVTKD